MDYLAGRPAPEKSSGNFLRQQPQRVDLPEWLADPGLSHPAGALAKEGGAHVPGCFELDDRLPGKGTGGWKPAIRRNGRGQGAAGDVGLAILIDAIQGAGQRGS